MKSPSNTLELHETSTGMDENPSKSLKTSIFFVPKAQTAFQSALRFSGLLKAAGMAAFHKSHTWLRRCDDHDPPRAFRSSRSFRWELRAATRAKPCGGSGTSGIVLKGSFKGLWASKAVLRTVSGKRKKASRGAHSTERAMGPDVQDVGRTPEVPVQLPPRQVLRHVAATGHRRSSF